MLLPQFITFDLMIPKSKEFFPFPTFSDNAGEFNLLSENFCFRQMEKEMDRQAKCQLQVYAPKIFFRSTHKTLKDTYAYGV